MSIDEKNKIEENEAGANPAKLFNFFGFLDKLRKIKHPRYNFSLFSVKVINLTWSNDEISFSLSPNSIDGVNFEIFKNIEEVCNNFRVYVKYKNCEFYFSKILRYNEY